MGNYSALPKTLDCNITASETCINLHGRNVRKRGRNCIVTEKINLTLFIQNKQAGYFDGVGSYRNGPPGDSCEEWHYSKFVKVKVM